MTSNKFHNKYNIQFLKSFKIFSQK